MISELDAQLQAVMLILRAEGGVVKIDPDANDDTKRAFLKMILDCPDCRKLLEAHL